LTRTADALARALLDGLRDHHPAQAASAIVQTLAALALLHRQPGEAGDIPLPALIDQAHDAWRRGKPAPEVTPPFVDTRDIQRLSEADQALLFRRLDDHLGRDGLASPALVLDLCLTLARRADTRGEFVSLSPLLNEILLAVLAPVFGETAYCAYAGAAETAMTLGLRGVKVRLDLERGLSGFWSAVATASGVDVTVTDAATRAPYGEIEPPSAAPYDLAIVVPPFGRRLEFPRIGMTSEMAGIELAVAAARRSLVVVPASVMFRTTGADQAFKAQLIEREALRAVAALPAGALLPHTNIASGLLVFGAGANDERILMLDPSAKPADHRLPALFSAAINSGEAMDWGRLVHPSEIAAQGFNMSPERYVLSPDARRMQAALDAGPTAPLGDLVEIVRPQMVVGTRAQSAGLPEISVGDIGDFGLVERPARHVEPDADQFGRVAKARVRENDILLVAKGSVGRAGFVDSSGEDWIASQSFVILRTRRHGPLADAAYLYRYLTSEVGQTLLQSVKAGTTVPMLQMADIKGFPVLLPPAGEQARIGAEVRELFALQTHIAALRREGLERQARIWPVGNL